MSHQQVDIPSVARMIFFIHVPKTAGTSFRMAVQQRFGSRVLCDYGTNRDATSDEIVEHVHERPNREALRGVINEGNIVMLCGHVPYKKYRDIAPPERVVVFLRDPVQRVISEFHHHRRHKDYKRSLVEFASQSPERNKQWKMVAGLDLDRAGLIGLTEHYEKALALLAMRLGFELPRLVRNTNPEKRFEAHYSVSEEDWAAVRALNIKDVRLYREAAERFAKAVGIAVVPSTISRHPASSAGV